MSSPLDNALADSSQPAQGKLVKALARRHVMMISLGGIIGAGLFVGSSAAISAVGPAAILSYVMAGLLVLLVMRMLAEMAVANPDSGSFTEYARAGLGPWAGFVSGWLYWYFWVVVVAIEAIAGASLLQQWIGLPVWQLGLALMVLLTATNLFSTRSYGEFEFWFASIKVAAIIVFIVIAASYAFGLTSDGISFGNLSSDGGFAPFGVAAIFAGITSVVFSMVGAEIVTVVAAESQEPARAIAKLTTSLIWRITLFYVGSIFFIVSIVPWRSIQPGISPFAQALDAMHVRGAAMLMNALVLVAVLSCLNSGLYVTSRVLFGLAAKGDAPHSMVVLNRRGVPVRAVLAGCSFGFLAVVISVASPQKIFAFLVSASGALMLIIYLLIAFAQVRLRRRMEASDPTRVTVRMWFFPWASYLVIVAIIGILASMLFTRELATQLGASLLCVAVVVACYFVLRRRGHSA